MQMTSFGHCTGLSSGLTCIGWDYTLYFLQREDFFCNWFTCE